MAKKARGKKRKFAKAGKTKGGKKMMMGRKEMDKMMKKNKMMEY